MTIELVPYDPTWPAKFEAERLALVTVLGPWLAGNIEHIGSTSVPNLCAKPVIDIMAPVQSLEASRSAIDTAVEAGYVYFPYKPDVMHWFCKPSPEFRTHHLHMVPTASALWYDRLAFRDALRGDAKLAAEYAALKARLAVEFRDDREAYTDAKTPFIARVLNHIASTQQKKN